MTTKKTTDKEADTLVDGISQLCILLQELSELKTEVVFKLIGEPGNRPYNGFVTDTLKVLTLHAKMDEITKNLNVLSR